LQGTVGIQWEKGKFYLLPFGLLTLSVRRGMLEMLIIHAKETTVLNTLTLEEDFSICSVQKGRLEVGER